MAALHFLTKLRSWVLLSQKSHCSFISFYFDRIFKRSNASLKILMLRSTISEKVLTINWDRRIEFGSSLSSKLSRKKEIPLLNGISFYFVECFFPGIFCDRIFKRSNASFKILMLRSTISEKVLTINWDRRIEFDLVYRQNFLIKKNPIAQWDFFYFVECFFPGI